MTEVIVRKSGGATIISIPKVVAEMAGVSVGSVLELNVVDHSIVLTPKRELTLDELLAGSPREKLRLPEDDEWLDMDSTGQEA